MCMCVRSCCRNVHAFADQRMHMSTHLRMHPTQAAGVCEDDKLYIRGGQRGRVLSCCLLSHCLHVCMREASPPLSPAHTLSVPFEELLYTAGGDKEAAAEALRARGSPHATAAATNLQASAHDSPPQPPPTPQPDASLSPPAPQPQALQQPEKPDEAAHTQLPPSEHEPQALASSQGDHTHGPSEAVQDASLSSDDPGTIAHAAAAALTAVPMLVKAALPSMAVDSFVPNGPDAATHAPDAPAGSVPPSRVRYSTPQLYHMRRGESAQGSLNLPEEVLAIYGAPQAHEGRQYSAGGRRGRQSQGHRQRTHQSHHS